jgi:hypothetical protein
MMNFLKRTVEMWRFWGQKPSTTVTYLSREIDFTRPTLKQWASYEGGDNFSAQFRIRGNVANGDEILIPMRSGRIGRYCLYSVLRDFSGTADWKVRGCAVGYQKFSETTSPICQVVKPAIKGLLGDGSRGLQPNSSQLAHVQGSFTEPTSEFWKILVRDEARSARADRMRTASHL